MTVNDALRALCDELAADGVPAPLAQPLTLASVWCDLGRLAGEEVPAAVVALLEAAEDVAGEPYQCAQVQAA